MYGVKRVLASFFLALAPVAAVVAQPAKVMAPGGPGGGYDAAARVPLQVMQVTCMPQTGHLRFFLPSRGRLQVGSGSWFGSRGALSSPLLH